MTSGGGADEGIDYEKLLREFGTQPIDEAVLKRFEEVTGAAPHPWLRRGVFFSHRDLLSLLDAHEKKEPMYLYTGRGPSSASLHLGHLMPFIFTKWLQDVFDCPLVIQLTDDEKYLWKDLTEEEIHEMLINNVKDIIAVGFKPDKTFIFNNLAYMGTMYPLVVQISKRITASTVKATFGVSDSDCIGKFAFCASQIAPSFPACFPHIFGRAKKVRVLVPCGIDQDPFFRLARDVAHRLKFPKASVLHSKFFPALQGSNTKMSASNQTSAIYMSDTANQIKNKINKYAFSGGQETLELHRELGGRTDVDVSYMYLTFFHLGPGSDEELAEIKEQYEKGTMSTGELKAKLIGVLQEIVAKHQEAHAKVTDEVIAHYMSVRPLDYHVPQPPPPPVKKSKKKK